MPLIHNGLVKLLEELGELGQEAAKKIAYPEGCGRFFGKNDSKLEDEMGDVMAAIWFVQEKLGLSDHDTYARAVAKYNVLKDWDSGGDKAWEKP